MTAKRSAPAIPLFGDAYLADTRHLSLEEHGAYLQLLMIAWRIDGCCLPDDDVRLARMLGVTKGKWAKLKPTVMSFWECSDGAWRQRRLTKERQFVEEKSAKNKASADARWEAKSLENIEGEECERISERNTPPPPPPQVEEEDEAAPHLRAPRQPVGEAVGIWNESAQVVGWPMVTSVNEGRRRSVAARLRERQLEGWRAGIIRARASPYLGGTDPPAWFTFDWFIKPGNFLKVIEGNYDKSKGSARGTDPILAALREAQADCAAADQAAHPGAWPALPAASAGTA